MISAKEFVKKSRGFQIQTWLQPTGLIPGGRQTGSSLELDSIACHERFLVATTPPDVGFTRQNLQLVGAALIHTTVPFNVASAPPSRAILRTSA